MTIGPEPISRIFRMSVRLGIDGVSLCLPNDDRRCASKCMDVNSPTPYSSRP